MTGEVNTAGEAVVHLKVRNSSGGREVVEAVVDTGFTGFLTLPQAVVGSLSLPLLGSTPATLADGTTAALEVCEALVVWQGRQRPVECLVTGGAPLLGMALLRGSELRIRVITGGDVWIEEIPFREGGGGP